MTKALPWGALRRRLLQPGRGSHVPSARVLRPLPPPRRLEPRCAQLSVCACVCASVSRPPRRPCDAPEQPTHRAGRAKTREDLQLEAAEHLLGAHLNFLADVGIALRFFTGAFLFLLRLPPRLRR